MKINELLKEGPSFNEHEDALIEWYERNEDKKDAYLRAHGKVDKDNMYSDASMKAMHRVLGKEYADSKLQGQVGAARWASQVLASYDSDAHH